MFFDFIIEFIYGIAYMPAMLIDTLLLIFRSLLGLAPITIASDSGTSTESSDILTSFLTQGPVFTVFISVAFAAFVIILLFGLLQVVRAIINDEGGKASPGRIFKRCIKSFMVLAVIPIVVIGGITASNTLMRGIDKSMSAGAGSDNLSIGGCIIAMTINVDDDSIWKGKYKDENNYMEWRKQFVQNVKSGRLTDGTETYSYAYMNTALDMWKYNIIMPIIAGFIALVAIGMGAFSVGQRLWDVMILYCTSPVVAATIPLDDGGRFKIWREIFIGKVLSSYGLIFAINLLASFSGIMLKIQIPGFSSFANSVVQLLLVLSGVMSIASAPKLLSTLIGSSAANFDNEQGKAVFRNVMGGMALGKTALRVGAKTFKSVPNNAAKMYGGMKAVGGGVRNTALRTVAGATFLTSKMGGKGASMHDKMMTALHGNKYKGSIAERRQNKKQEIEYRKGKGMTKHDVKKTEHRYKKLFDKQDRFENGGYVGQKKK